MKYRNKQSLLLVMIGIMGFTPVFSGSGYAQDYGENTDIFRIKLDAFAAASEKYNAGDIDLAIEQLRGLAVSSADDNIAAKSRKAILDHYWKVDDYGAYIAAASSLPERIAGYDEGQADLRCGYIFIRQFGDLESAKKSFEKCGNTKGENSKEGRAAVKWVGLLEKAHNTDSITDEELNARFKKFIIETQGGISRTINPLDLARRTYQYSMKVPDNNVKLRLLQNLSNDPIYGIYGRKAHRDLAIIRNKSASGDYAS
ncbi:MAG: hypothetical protein ACFCU1_00805, partial [Sumerlaeia bacterium]